MNDIWKDIIEFDFSQLKTGQKHKKMSENRSLSYSEVLTQVSGVNDFEANIKSYKNLDRGKIYNKDILIQSDAKNSDVRQKIEDKKTSEFLAFDCISYICFLL